mgnify:FL=1|tara:strand:- start:241 stop:909 length:669 start_codon:yes stop_codon:yes gene_type:complete
MINAWSLLYDELYGDDEMTDDINITTGIGNSVVNVPLGISDDILTIDGGDTINFDDAPLAFNTFADNDDSISHHIEVPTGDFVNFDLGVGNTAYSDTLNINVPDPDYFASMDGVELPTPGIEDKTIRKYKEDESIKALQEYISTTYGGHYTSDNNNVQTLDLIESVGDAESFCRSNAIKYLSRYDKKGQAKRDILKALHYSLLLYHFSGQLNETPTRGYETF